MKQIIRAGIAGVGKYVPPARLTNAYFERIVDTTDAWIVQRTGIRERRKAADDQVCSDLARHAAIAALDDAGITAEDLDLILLATITGDQPFPATACRVGADLGAANAGGYDVSGACSGFVYALRNAAAFVGVGYARRVLVIGAEKLTSIVDYTDRNTCVLFGDGAGAAVVTPLDEAGRGEILGGTIGMAGGQEDVLTVPGGGSRRPTSHATVDAGLHTMKMGGTKVFRFAVKVFADLVQETIDEHGADQLGIVIPHQVNQRIIEAAAERVGLPMDRFFVNIDAYGNTSAASVPIALCEALDAGRVPQGKIACLVAFGAGMSWGRTLLRW